MGEAKKLQYANAVKQGTNNNQISQMEDQQMEIESTYETIADLSPNINQMAGQQMLKQDVHPHQYPATKPDIRSSSFPREALSDPSISQPELRISHKSSSFSVPDNPKRPPLPGLYCMNTGLQGSKIFENQNLQQLMKETRPYAEVKPSTDGSHHNTMDWQQNLPKKEPMEHKHNLEG
jgi:hypothetical protein